MSSLPDITTKASAAEITIQRRHVMRHIVEIRER